MSQVGLSMSSGQADPQQRPPKGSKVAVLGAVVVVLGILVVAGIVAFRMLSSGVQDYPGAGSGTVVVKVNTGDSLTAIGQTLAKSDVVASTEAFVEAAAANPAASSIQPGAYQLRQQMSAQLALEALLDPANRVGSVLIPEGTRALEAVRIASKATETPLAEYLPYLEDPSELSLPTWSENHIEGFLFPAKYDFAPGASAKEQLQAMIDKFKAVAAEINLERRASEMGRSPYDIVIVGSLVEAEGKADDFAKISRVIYNRLDCSLQTCKDEFIQKRLQMDSTINYAKGTDELNLSGEDLREDGPFNTHQNSGLPPTPINNPGELALEAALTPATGDWLYFVSDDGFTEFSNTFAEQQDAEARWRAGQGE